MKGDAIRSGFEDELPRVSFPLVSCEHAGNEVPATWRHVFAAGTADGLPPERTESVLAGHRGWDPGALGVAARLAQRLAAPLLAVPVTRLLVDVNRSHDAHDVFSEWTRELPVAERGELLATLHAPHRASVERCVASAIRSAHRVLQLSVHSFVDVLDGRIRDVDLGLLFDPARMWERRLAETWAARLAELAPEWRIRFNEPYLGVDDGLATSLRRRFGAGAYAGVEVEIRQGMIRTSAQQRTVADLLAAGLAGRLVEPVPASFDRGAGPIGGAPGPGTACLDDAGASMAT